MKTVLLSSYITLIYWWYKWHRLQTPLASFLLIISPCPFSPSSTSEFYLYSTADWMNNLLSSCPLSFTSVACPQLPQVSYSEFFTAFCHSYVCSCHSAGSSDACSYQTTIVRWLPVHAYLLYYPQNEKETHVRLKLMTLVGSHPYWNALHASAEWSSSTLLVRLSVCSAV